MGVADAAATGDELETLNAMRDRLAEVMDVAPPYVVGPISGRLVTVLGRIAELSAEPQATLADVLAERRANRTTGGRADG